MLIDILQQVMLSKWRALSGFAVVTKKLTADLYGMSNIIMYEEQEGQSSLDSQIQISLLFCHCMPLHTFWLDVGINTQNTIIMSILQNLHKQLVKSGIM